MLYLEPMREFFFFRIKMLAENGLKICFGANSQISNTLDREGAYLHVEVQDQTVLDFIIDH